MPVTVAKQETGTDELYFTLEFLFNSGKTEPSTLAGLPRSQVYRFGCDELMDWLDLSEEDAVEIIDNLLTKLDNGKRSKHVFVFDGGESFSISVQDNEE